MERNHMKMYYVFELIELKNQIMKCLMKNDSDYAVIMAKHIYNALPLTHPLHLIQKVNGEQQTQLLPSF